MRLHLIALLTATALWQGPSAGAANSSPQPAISLHGTPALAPDFAIFPYANAAAPKGGRVTLGLMGSYDSLNPLIIKGVAAAGVREFSVESLMTRGLDEPFTLYGLLAKSIDLADDGRAVSFKLDERAEFSDGHPVTAGDVIFSFNMLKTKGRPNHRTYFAKVVAAEPIGDREVRFTFQDAADRELPLILGLMPVFASHATDAETFDKTSLAPMTGSGPYTLKSIDAGRSLTYQRNPKYWGRDLGVNKGRFNFDEIRFDYYRESSVMLEAFKRGAIDMRLEDDPGRWADAYDVPAVRDGRIVKGEFEIGLPAGMTALVFNTRRAVFADPLVRRALITAFDFEWVNRILFNGLYKRNESFFDRSYLSSVGKPADATEQALLAPFPQAVRAENLAGASVLSASDGSGQNRANQRTASQLLKQAGYVMQSGVLVEEKTGRPLAFEILANNSAQEALLLSYARSLEPLGIRARVRVVDSAQYQGRLSNYDFDMIQNSWPSSLSPGNEQLFRWSSDAAKTPGTYNFAGVQSPAADAMIAAMLAAKTEVEFVSAVRALDRVLLSGDYAVPLYYIPRQWVAYWKRLAHPEKTPVFGYAFDTWWVEANP